MKIMITGICGRIGSELAKQLQKEGHHIVGFDIRSPHPKHILPSIKYIKGSLLDIPLLIECLSTIDSVAHLAAQMTWDNKKNNEMIKNNVHSTFTLLEASATAKIKRFVFASTGEVYPEVLPKYLPVDEKHPLLPTSLYGETKKIGEDLVHFFGRSYKLPYVILRFPHTQNAEELLDSNSFFSGPRFFLQAKIKQMESLNKQEIVSLLQKYDKGYEQHLLQCNEKGESYKMHISDTRDTARGILLALTHEKALGETFNLGTDTPVIFSNALELMSKITNYEIVKVAFPGPGVRYCTDNTKIKTILGYKANYSFESMLKEAAISFKKRRDEKENK